MILNLKKKLEEWADAGHLTAEQSQRILAHEESGSSRPWVIYGIVGIGVITVATGVVSIIAANWNDFPASLKLFGYFILQILAGAAVVSQWEKNSPWREGAIVLFSLLFFGGIGLFAQIFNLHGATWRPLAFWLVLTLPLTVMARNKISHHGWVILTLVAGFYWADESRSFLSGNARACFYFALPLILTGFGFFAQRIKGFPEGLRLATIVWGIAPVLIVATIAANVAWLSEHKIFHPEDMKYLLITWAALIFAMAGSAMRVVTVSRSVPLLTALMLLAIGLYFTLPIIGVQLYFPDLIARQLVGALGFLIVWALAAATSASGNYKRFFDIASCIIAIRFIVIYFEVFGNLSTTGVGLIISGLVILGIAAVWYRYRTMVAVKLRGKS